MFGQLRPAARALDRADRRDYARAYCHVCGLISGHLGYPVRLLLVHDVVSLAWMLGIGAEPGGSPGLGNCLRPGSTRRIDRTAGLGQLLAGASALMLQIKHEDDLRDGQAGRWRLLGGLLRSASTKAQPLLASGGLDLAALRQLVQQAHHLERQPGLELEAYAGPTAAAYGHLAEAIDRAMPGQRPAGHVSAREAGQILGTLVYLADAAEDYRSDRRQGRFNPLSAAPGEAAAALSATLQSLSPRLEAIRLPGAPQQRFRALVARLVAQIERHRRQLAATGGGRAARERQIALNLICCMPCGPGGVAIEDDDLANLCCACICCCVCTSCLSSC